MPNSPCLSDAGAICRELLPCVFAKRPKEKKKTTENKDNYFFSFALCSLSIVFRIYLPYKFLPIFSSKEIKREKDDKENYGNSHFLATSLPWQVRWLRKKNAKDTPWDVYISPMQTEVQGLPSGSFQHWRLTKVMQETFSWLLILPAL